MPDRIIIRWMIDVLDVVRHRFFGVLEHLIHCPDNAFVFFKLIEVAGVC